MPVSKANPVGMIAHKSYAFWKPTQKKGRKKERVGHVTH